MSKSSSLVPMLAIGAAVFFSVTYFGQRKTGSATAASANPYWTNTGANVWGENSAPTWRDALMVQTIRDIFKSKGPETNLNNGPQSASYIGTNPFRYSTADGRTYDNESLARFTAANDYSLPDETRQLIASGGL